MRRQHIVIPPIGESLPSAIPSSSSGPIHPHYYWSGLSWSGLSEPHYPHLAIRTP